jgi:hypothetical protein
MPHSTYLGISELINFVIAVIFSYIRLCFAEGIFSFHFHFRWELSGEGGICGFYQRALKVVDDIGTKILAGSARNMCLRKTCNYSIYGAIYLQINKDVPLDRAVFFTGI